MATAKFQLDPSSELANKINLLFNTLFNPDTSLKQQPSSFSTVQMNDILNKCTNYFDALLAVLHKDHENPAAAVLLDNLIKYAENDVSVVVDIIAGRSATDPIVQLISCITASTAASTIFAGSKNLNMYVDKGPLRKSRISLANIDKSVINNAIPQIKALKNPEALLAKEIPSKFAALAKYKNMAAAAGRRCAFQGNTYHNIETMESMYTKLGKALVFVSLDFVETVNACLSYNAKRRSAEDIINFDFKNLSPKEAKELEQTFQNAFQKYANYTAEINQFTRIEDKMVVDAAMYTYYYTFSDEQRKNCGFDDEQLAHINKAIEFSKKYPVAFQARHQIYLNAFVDGVIEAVEKEQNTLTKEKFENPVTGQVVYRRGRLAGKGNKFMNLAAIKWIGERLDQKDWISLWAIPKLGLAFCRIITNPTVHRVRKKLTNLLKETLSSFAKGFKESYDEYGNIGDVTIEDLRKAVEDGISELRDIKDVKTTIKAESLGFNSNKFTAFLHEAKAESYTIEDRVNTLEKLIKLAEKYQENSERIENLSSLQSAAISEESGTEERNKYTHEYDALEELIDLLKDINLEEKLKIVVDVDNADARKALAKAAGTPGDMDEYDAKIEQIKNILINGKNAANTAYDEKLSYDAKVSDDEELNASGEETGAKSTGSIEADERILSICDNVYDVARRYIAKQWNLLATHNLNDTLPLAAFYKPFDLDKKINEAAAIKAEAPIIKNDCYRSVLGMTLSEYLKLTEAAENDPIQNRELTSDEAEENIKNKNAYSDFKDVNDAVDAAKKHYTDVKGEEPSKDTEEMFRKYYKTTAIKNNAEREELVRKVYNARGGQKGTGLDFDSFRKKYYAEYKDVYYNPIGLGYASRNAKNIVADYPIKYGNYWRYHGIEFKAAQGTQLNGFGQLAKNFIDAKLLIIKFVEFVNTFGEESTKKVYNLSDTTDRYSNESIHAKYLKIMNEDIVNKLQQKVYEPAVKKAKTGIKNVAKAVGGKLGNMWAQDVNRPEYKMREIMSMPLISNYKLKPIKFADLRDGLNIVAAHSLSEKASNIIKKIAEFINILAKANITSAYSLEQLTSALKVIDYDYNLLAPCQTIVDKKLAEYIISGKLTDSADPKLGKIKGLYVGNWLAATEYGKEDYGDKKLNTTSKSDEESTSTSAAPASATDSTSATPAAETGSTSSKTTSAESAPTTSESFASYDLHKILTEMNIFDWRKYLND